MELVVENPAAEADPKRLPVIAATLATVVAEDSSRVSGTARRYLDTIETWGYQPTEAEQAQRLRAESEQPAV